MCNNENHFELPQAAHFTRHSMEVERLYAVARRVGTISVELVQQEALDALALADGGVPRECVQQLQQVANGEVRFQVFA